MQKLSMDPEHMRKHRLFVLAAILASVVFSVQAVRGYISSIPSYDAMGNEADLIVIATPLIRKELHENAFLPGVSRAGSRIPAVSIETKFRTSAVLKGSLKGGHQFVLLHFRERDTQPIVTAGPYLIDFQPGDGSQYLMFLKLRNDGRYEAYQEVEPGWCVEKLQQKINAPSSAR